MLKPKTIILFFLIVSHAIFSNEDVWGKVGHQVIGEIATQNLSLNAMYQVKKILDGQSLSLVSTWADEMRSNPEFSKYNSWHYVNMPLDKEYSDIQKNPKGDIVTTLKECIRVLKDPESSKESKSFYLKFLIHLVGDIHQPYILVCLRTEEVMT